MQETISASDPKHSLLVDYPTFERLVIDMIAAVSSAHNRDDMDSSKPAWHYIPRYADRLDAIGLSGINRSI